MMYFLQLDSAITCIYVRESAYMDIRCVCVFTPQNKKSAIFATQRIGHEVSIHRIGVPVC